MAAHAQKTITAFSQDDLLLLLLLSHILTATPAPQVDDQTNLAAAATMLSRESVTTSQLTRTDRRSPEPRLSILDGLFAFLLQDFKPTPLLIQAELLCSYKNCIIINHTW